MKINHDPSTSNEVNPMDKLLAKLSEQQAVINKQHEALRSSEDTSYANTLDYVAPDISSLPITPALESFNNTTAVPTNSPSVTGADSSTQNVDEVARLKAELEAARGKIARMDQELAQTRITKHTLDQAIGNTSEADYPLTHQVDDRLNHLPPNVRPQIQRDNSWAGQDDSRSDTSDALSASGFNRARALWGNAGKPAFAGAQGAFQPSEALNPAQWMNRGFGQPFVDGPMASMPPMPSVPTMPSMPYTGPPMNAFRNNGMMPDPELLMAPPTARRGPVGGRFNNRSSAGSFPYASSNSSFDGYTPSTTPFGSVAGINQMSCQTGMGMNMGANAYAGYQPQPIGTPLSPHAPEFTSSSAVSWKNDVSAPIRPPSLSVSLVTFTQAVATEGQTYLPTTEPLNYRRLLDRTVNCNWKYIVDKIVCNNDQQASIFLQQKLKVGTTEQKYDIVEAIVAQAYPLMVNRFGNFLVQRCFEHGTPEQVIKIAEAIRGNTLNLSMDAFGCHVVQKAFDSVPEDYKAIMVHELLRRIPETVIHRYACHVWQKLFELRWTESPPQIMKYVNEALRGMWHEVALGETGSLVVQNIFENCLEEDKASNSPLPNSNN
jgi:Pumilio-family RNA binding repeat